MKPKELKVGDKVFLVKEASMMHRCMVLGVEEVTEVTSSSIYVGNTRFPIEGRFPLFHQTKSDIDRRQHLWLTSEDYNAYLAELRKDKESKAERALRSVTEGLGHLSDTQLDNLSSDLNKLIVSMGPIDEK